MTTAENRSGAAPVRTAPPTPVNVEPSLPRGGTMSDEFAGLNWTADDRALWAAGVQPIHCTQNAAGVWAPQLGTTGGAPQFAQYPRPVGVPMRPALRPPLGAVLFDVDAGRDGKVGDRTIVAMEQALGKLHATWRLTARGANHPSGRYLYRIPEDLVITDAPFTAFGGSVEVVRFGHRFSWAPGDVHPSTGTQVVCYAPNGRPCSLPPVSAWPMLPDAWVAYFRSFTRSGATFSGPTGEARQVAIGAARGHAKNTWQTVVADHPESGSLRANIGKWAKAEGSLLVAQGHTIESVFENLCTKITTHEKWGAPEWDQDLTWGTIVDYLRRYVVAEPISLTADPVYAWRGMTWQQQSAEEATLAARAQEQVTAAASLPVLGLSIPANPMPALVLPPVMGAAVDAVCAALRVPREAALFAALGALSSAGSTLAVRVNPSFAEPLALFLACFGEPGTFKSSTLKLLTRTPLNTAQAALRDATGGQDDIELAKARERVAALTELTKAKRHQASKLSAPVVGLNVPDFSTLTEVQELDRAAAALAEAERSLATLEAQRGNPDLWRSDTTPEGLVKLMSANDGPAALVSPEGGLLRTLLGKYSADTQIDLSDINSGYDAEEIKSERAGREVRLVRKALLTVVVMPQPHLLELLLAPESRDSGFASRFLLALPRDPREHMIENPGSVPGPVLDAWTEVVTRLMRRGWASTPDKADELGASPAAAGHLNAFGESIRKWALGWPSDAKSVRDWGAKAGGRAWRVAALLQLAHDPDASVVDEWAACSAVALLGWQASECTRLLYGDGERLARDEPLIGCAEALLKRSSPRRKPTHDGFFPPHEIASAAYAFRGKTGLVFELLTTLAQQGLAEEKHHAETGEPLGRFRPAAGLADYVRDARK